MARGNLEITQDLFVDESGFTSLEPDTYGPRHRFPGGWTPFAEFDAYDPWEAPPDPDPFPQRGRLPVEGDGDGGPE